ncbi:MAG: M20 family metallopeptidase [Thermoplasmata archaeon]|nr:M20 family metallopeptidase [Thermoplasmata archaeon]
MTLVFAPGPDHAGTLLARARAGVESPFRVTAAGASELHIPPGAPAISVIGQSAHGGYPHRGHNPVPAALALLRHGLKGGWIDGTPPLQANFAIDLRLPPEMALADGLAQFQGWADGWIRSYGTPAHVDAPAARCRGGYALPLDHPALLRLERILTETLAAHGIFGEYGGTDASALGVLKTASGDPLPAIVFGRMDRMANIHQAEESADPALIAGVARTIERFVREP